MARLKPLMSLNDLSTTYLKSLSQSKARQLFVNYDDDFDALMVLFVPPETETVVHYVDEHVGLLYRPDDQEIVGFQVEAFEHSFVPAHASVERAWRLSAAVGSRLEDFGDLMLVVDEMKPRVAREIVKVNPHLPEELAAVFS